MGTRTFTLASIELYAVWLSNLSMPFEKDFIRTKSEQKFLQNGNRYVRRAVAATVGFILGKWSGVGRS